MSEGLATQCFTWNGERVRRFACSKRQADSPGSQAKGMSPSRKEVERAFLEIPLLTRPGTGTPRPQALRTPEGSSKQNPQPAPPAASTVHGLRAAAGA